MEEKAICVNEHERCLVISHWFLINFSPQTTRWPSLQPCACINGRKRLKWCRFSITSLHFKEYRKIKCQGLRQMPHWLRQRVALQRTWVLLPETTSIISQLPITPPIGAFTPLASAPWAPTLKSSYLYTDKQKWNKSLKIITESKFSKYYLLRFIGLCQLYVHWKH